MKAIPEKMTSPPGLGGFGDVGEARMNFNRMSQGMHRLKEISENVEADNCNPGMCIKELTDTVREVFMSTGSMFQQEDRRFLHMLAATGGGGYGGGHGGGSKYQKTIMEHKVIQYLRTVNGDKSLFRQWHQKFTTALGQVPGAHEEIIQRMVKEIDLGKELEKVVTTLKDEHEEFGKVSGDVWNVLIDKAEAEAYDKIKMVPKGQGVIAYGVLYRWFTDVSGLGLAEQARMLMAPTAPKREEDLAEHVEMWQDKMRRLEAHGEEFKLAPVFKINALRTLMVGKSKEYFDLWESDKDHTDPSKSYEELMAKLKDYSRRKKMDNTAREKIQHGGEPMDVGAVGGWSWNDDTGGGYD